MAGSQGPLLDFNFRSHCEPVCVTTTSYCVDTVQRDQGNGVLTAIDARRDLCRSLWVSSEYDEPAQHSPVALGMQGPRTMQKRIVAE